MRGCLSIIVLAIAFIVAGTWFFGTAVAGAVVESGLSLTGFDGRNTEVSVAADPPVKLLTAHADTVRIRSEEATLAEFTAAHLDMTLTDVDLLTRQFVHVEGSLRDVTMQASDESTLRASTVEFAGDADAAATTITVESDMVTAMAIDTISNELGVEATDVKLVPPNGISFASGGSTIAGRFVIVNGGVAVSAELPGNPQIDLVRPVGALRFTNVSVGEDGLVLHAQLDVERLLR